MQMLLDKGADINALGNSFSTAIEEASSRGHFEVVQILLDRGADANAVGQSGIALLFLEKDTLRLWRCC